MKTEKRMKFMILRRFAIVSIVAAAVIAGSLILPKGLPAVSGAKEASALSLTKVISIYYLTFNPNGGTCSKFEKAFFVNLPVGALPTAKRKGYFFLGWYTTKKGGTKITSKTIIRKKGNKTIYAHWKVNAKTAPKKYILTFNPAPGICMTLEKAFSNFEPVGTLPSATLTDHIFTGWWTAKQGGTHITEKTLISKKGHKTLYAHWKKKPATKVIPGKDGAAKVSINSASSATLQTVNGIGPAMAKKIIAYRKKHKFKKLTELKKIAGIGEATYKKIVKQVEL